MLLYPAINRWSLNVKTATVKPAICQVKKIKWNQCYKVLLYYITIVYTLPIISFTNLLIKYQDLWQKNFSRDKVLYGDKFMSLMWVTDAIEAAEHHATLLSKLKMSKTRTFLLVAVKVDGPRSWQPQNVLNALIA